MSKPVLFMLLGAITASAWFLFSMFAKNMTERGYIIIPILVSLVAFACCVWESMEIHDRTKGK